MCFYKSFPNEGILIAQRSKRKQDGCSGQHRGGRPRRFLVLSTSPGLLFQSLTRVPSIQVGIRQSRIPLTDRKAHSRRSVQLQQATVAFDGYARARELPMAAD